MLALLAVRVRSETPTRCVPVPAPMCTFVQRLWSWSRREEEVRNMRGHADGVWKPAGPSITSDRACANITRNSPHYDHAARVAVRTENPGHGARAGECGRPAACLCLLTLGQICTDLG